MKKIKELFIAEIKRCQEITQKRSTKKGIKAIDLIDDILDDDGEYPELKEALDSFIYAEGNSPRILLMEIALDYLEI